MPCIDCRYQSFVDTQNIPLHPVIYQVSQQFHPLFLENLTPMLYGIMILMISWHERIFERKRRRFQSLSRTNLVVSKSSSSWGVLLPNKRGKIRLIEDGSVEVATIHLGQDNNLELNKEIWGLNSLKLLRADNPLSKVQTFLVTAVQQKLSLQADLEKLTAHAQRAKEMYDLAKGVESVPEIVRRYEDIYLQDLAAISQLNISQAFQDKNIKQLLLFVEMVKFDKENIVANFQHRSETITETKQNYLESVDRVKEYLKLQA